jgi:hypothetical protein
MLDLPLLHVDEDCRSRDLVSGHDTTCDRSAVRPVVDVVDEDLRRGRLGWGLDRELAAETAAPLSRSSTFFLSFTGYDGLLQSAFYLAKSDLIYGILEFKI